MSSRTKLRRALGSIDDAKRALVRAQHNAKDDSLGQIKQAITELEEAEADIKRAIRELPTE